jgi:hypothetical protein
MRYKIVSPIILICILYTAGAVGYIDGLRDVVESYNNNLGTAPDTIKNLLKCEKVNIEISLGNGSLLEWGFETENAKIVSHVQGSVKNPTIEVYATEKALDNVLNATDPVASYLQEENAGNIRIKGNTLGSILRLGTALLDAQDIKLFLGLFNSLN